MSNAQGQQQARHDHVSSLSREPSHVFLGIGIHDISGYAGRERQPLGLPSSSVTPPLLIVTSLCENAALHARSEIGTGSGLNRARFPGGSTLSRSHSMACVHSPRKRSRSGILRLLCRASIPLSFPFFNRRCSLPQYRSIKDACAEVPCAEVILPGKPGLLAPPSDNSRAPMRRLPRDVEATSTTTGYSPHRCAVRRSCGHEHRRRDTRVLVDPERRVRGVPIIATCQIGPLRRSKRWKGADS